MKSIFAIYLLSVSAMTMAQSDSEILDGIRQTGQTLCDELSQQGCDRTGKCAIR